MQAEHGRADWTLLLKKLDPSVVWGARVERRRQRRALDEARLEQVAPPELWMRVAEVGLPNLERLGELVGARQGEWWVAAEEPQQKRMVVGVARVQQGWAGSVHVVEQEH